MTQSMTGYSRTTRRILKGTVTVELRSTNHRYLEIGQRLPEGLLGLEGQVAELIRSKIRRGRVEVGVSAQVPQTASRRVVIDEALVQAYYERLLDVKGRFGLRGHLTLEHLLALPHVMSVVEDQAQRQALWSDIRQAVQDALHQLIAMRQAEGRRLVSDIRAQARRIRHALATIRRRLPQSVAQQKQRLQERVKALLGHSTATQAQLQEALAVVRETDVHEELVRLESHLTQLDQTLKAREGVGKKLDFIAQELMREANTLGAKANDGLITRAVVEIKEAIEKIREQAQNLE